MKLACTIRGWIVPQWLSIGWQAEEPSSCSVQEAGSLRTREPAMQSQSEAEDLKAP
jgi:hypothetical protein